MIEYVPIEFSPEPVEGENSLFIDCIWVLPKFWNAGVARNLLERFIEDAKACGGASVLAYEGDKWFGYFPYMPADFFRKFGFREVGRDGSRVLLYLNLSDGEQPRLIESKIRPVEKGYKIVVDIFFNSQCPWSWWMAEKVRRNARKCDSLVNIINTDDRKVIAEYGLSRGVCLNGVPVIKRIASWKEIDPIIRQTMPS